MLLNLLQCAGQHHNRELLRPNVRGAEGETLCSIPALPVLGMFSKEGGEMWSRSLEIDLLLPIQEHGKSR